MRRKIQKRAKSPKKPEIRLDSPPRKKRGRPGIRPSLVVGRANNYALQLEQVWEELEAPLMNAQSANDVIAAFATEAEFLQRHFVPMFAETILELIREPRFPKRAAARIRFLGDSLGGAAEGLRPRRSRDICSVERNKVVHRIMRREFYVECSCGYKGPALNDGCRKCGARVTGTFAGVQWGLFP
jgi:hypothetical protein